MATLQASRILEALNKAKQVGRIEEAATIAGCPLVFRNLSPNDYDAIHEETKVFDEVEYLHAYQIGHICRSVVEIGEQDLRDVEYIEDDVPTGAWGIAAYLSSKSLVEKFAGEIKKSGGKATIIKPDGETRTIKIERHEWLRDLIASWGRESVTVAWRKVMDVVTTADEKAKEGVQFKVPDESSEERFRRLLGELVETQEDLPSELVASVLAEAGYQSVSTAAELQAANARLQRMAEEDKAKQASKASVAPEVPEVSPEPEEAPQRAPEPSQVDPAELMSRRRPLNQRPVQVPAPPASAAASVSAAQPVQVPDQLRRAAEVNVAALRSRNGTPLVGRAAEIAALEAQVDPAVMAEMDQQPRRPYAGEIPELSQKTEAVDGKVLRASVDRPPVVGLNPRFRPPPGR